MQTRHPLQGRAFRRVGVRVAIQPSKLIMHDTATMDRLAESDAELARGEYVSAEELAEAMRRRQAQ